MAQKQKPDKDIVVSTTGGAAAATRRRSAAPRSKSAARTKPSTVEPVAAEETVAVSIAEIAVAVEPTSEAIAALAYSYWEARGCQGGSPEEDWLRAEQELRTR